ncbi:MAG: RNHCP domain-containing protein [Myxococcota bacterium]
MNTSELEQALNQLRSRGEIKRFGALLDAQPKQLALLRQMLIDRGDDVQDLDKGKQLIRRWLSRSQLAQQRLNPIHIDESFQCAYCHRLVSAGGEMIRDHCPYCLSSMHVDKVPGDRAANCGGQLLAVNLEFRAQQWWIHYCCQTCGHLHRVRAHPDDHLEAFSRS